MNSFANIATKDSSLRDYQQEAKEAIFAAWDEVNSVMFQMPTGTGKTRLFTSIINDINRWSVANITAVKILVIAHRTELIDQIDKSLQHYKIPHGIIAGNTSRNLKFPVQVASIQTITNKHNKKVAESLKVNFLIIDEAHHALARTYKLLWKLYPEAKRLGVTATPWRMSGCGFTELFEKLITSWTVKKFIESNYLSNYQYYSLRTDSDITKQIKSIHEFTIDGDYKTAALEYTMNTHQIRAQLLDSYQTLAAGKKGIIYAISQAHSKKICEEYASAGYRVAAIDSKTPKDERTKLVNDFKAGRLDIIVNVDIFSEGFDCPDIEFVQLARPTCSLAKYLQQVGRALRYVDGKSHAIILDNVGMYARFGLPDARRHWKHHFVGNNSSTEEMVQTLNSLGDGVGRLVDLRQGNEPMMLIQQTADVLPEEEPVIEVQQSHKMGPVTFDSGFVWNDPKHVFKNGVHYYTDCYGRDFCQYSDADSNWHFEICLKQYPDLRYNLLPPHHIICDTTQFSILCNLAHLQGEDLQYAGLCNPKDDDFQVMDFYDPHAKGKSNQIFFSNEAEHIEDLDSYNDMFMEESTKPSNYKKPELKTERDAFIYELSEKMRPTVVPNTEPIALLNYEFGVYADSIKVYANMNDGSQVVTTDVSIDSDLAKTLLDCGRNGYSCQVVCYFFQVKMQKKLLIVVNDPTVEECLLSFDESGNFYDDEKSKSVQTAQPTQPRAKTDTSNRDSKRWTAGEDCKLIDLYHRHKTYSEIANRLSRTEISVCKRLVKKGVLRYDDETGSYIDIQQSISPTEENIDQKKEPQDIKKDYNAIVTKYIDLFGKMKNTKMNGEGSPHKFVMMIAVMNCISANIAHRKNLIRYNRELSDSFRAVWEKYVQSSVFQSNAAMPFYYLKSEPFWKLVSKQGETIPSNVNRPDNAILKRTIEGAKIDMDLYEAIQDQKSYDKLKATLVKLIDECKSTN